MAKGRMKGDFIIIDLPVRSPGELIDTKTGVRYLCIRSDGGMIPRLNADGTPMIATQEEMDEILKEPDKKRRE